MIYSKRTFHFATFSVILLFVFYVLSLIKRRASWQLDDIIGFLIILLMVCAVLGVFTGFLSLNERPNKRKWVGLTLNLCVVIGIIMYLAQQVGS